MSDRPPVLALHGWLGRAADWAPVARALGSAAVWITPDLPGHGGPPLPGRRPAPPPGAEPLPDGGRSFSSGGRPLPPGGRPPPSGGQPPPSGGQPPPSGGASVSPGGPSVSGGGPLVSPGGALLSLPRGSEGEGAADFDGVADALVALLDARGVDRAVVAGYSMGGRLALHLALRHPARVAGLLLVGASPGLPTEEERAARRAQDAGRAAALRAAPDAFLERWYARPLWDPLDGADRARLAADRRAHLDPEGAAEALEALSVGAQPWLGDRLHEIRVPAVALAGSEDAKFAGLAQRMSAAGTVAASLVPGAGHALLAERPDAVADALERLLAAV